MKCVVLLAGVVLLLVTRTQGAAQISLAPLFPLQTCVTRNSETTCPDDDYMKFFLFVGSSSEGSQINVTDPNWPANSKFDKSLPTVLLVHGFSRANSMEILRDAYIKRGTHNVIMVDWVALAPVNCYLQAVGSLKGVAKCTSHVMNFLQKSGIDLTDITCIGHSLGAHICGLVPNYGTAKLKKIVGLDPARPLVDILPPGDRLDDKDAKVVQVIHTSAGFYGMRNMVGTADFCLNNGLQPYCRQAITALLCDHFQAICFYAESLDPERSRMGNPCIRACPQLNITIAGNPVRMGEHMEDSAEGMYCVTATEAPYCKKNGTVTDYGDARCCP